VTGCLPATSICAQFCIVASYWTGAKTEAEIVNLSLSTRQRCRSKTLGR
jgi:hypothetical protein